MNHSLSIRSWWSATGRRTTRTFLMGLLFVPASWAALTLLSRLPGILANLQAWVSAIGLLALTVLVIATIRQANRQQNNANRNER